MNPTTKEKIAIMQAFVDGKPIECLNCSLGIWEPCVIPLWDWLDTDYRIAAPTKPSWDWSHVNDDINFLVRQSPSHGGRALGTSHRPAREDRFWEFRDGRMFYVECFASYDPGTCDWRESLVVRPGYKEDVNNAQ